MEEEIDYLLLIKVCKDWKPTKLILKNVAISDKTIRLMEHQHFETDDYIREVRKFYNRQRKSKLDNTLEIPAPVPDVVPWKRSINLEVNKPLIQLKVVTIPGVRCWLN